MHCGSGDRAAIAASVLDRPGRQVLINDSYAAACEAGLEAEEPSIGADDTTTA